ncbi:MAG: hypothetical protein ABIK83_12980 [Candidatus Zixiibacteriota bacterium]
MESDIVKGIALGLTYLGILALIATVVFLVMYTRATQGLFRVTKDQYLKLTDPVLNASLHVCEIDPLSDVRLWVRLTNVSDNHSVALVTLSATFWSDNETVAQVDAYRSEREWIVQARHYSEGKLNLKDLINAVETSEYLSRLDNSVKDSCDQAYKRIKKRNDTERQWEKFPGFHFPPNLLCDPDASAELHLKVRYRSWNGVGAERWVILPTLTYYLRCERSHAGSEYLKAIPTLVLGEKKIE